MRILLTFVPLLPDNTGAKGINMLASPAIYLLGTVLREKGYEVTVLDQTEFYGTDIINGERNITSELLGKADVIALSSNSFNWGTTKRLIEAIRKLDSDIPIILGGLHPTRMDEYVLKTTGANIVVRKEGERTLPLVIQALEKKGLDALRSIPGITFKDKDGYIIRNQDAAALTEEEYNLVPVEDYSTIPDKTYIGISCETSRGCLYRCAFCGINHHGSWKTRTVDNAIRRIDNAISTAQKKCVNPLVFISDDCFTVNQDRMISLFDYMGNSRENFQLYLEGRLGDLSNETAMEHFPIHKVQRFLVGIESGYNEGLKMIRKGYTTDTIDKLMEQFKGHPLTKNLFCTFMIGLPWESEAECIKTVQYAAHIYEDYGVQCNVGWWSIIPSELWTNRKKYGINTDETLYDDPNWSMVEWNGPDSVFSTIHPGISAKGYEKLMNIIRIYDLRGINIFRN